MIVCTVCGIQNHHLSVVCSACGSFIQSKIDSIDLFSTIWSIIETPRAAFRRIAIVSHKNYAIFLGCIMGIALAFGVMWALKVGDSDLSLLHILTAGMLAGPVVGVCTLVLLAGLQRTVGIAFRLPARFRNVLGVTAYAAVPIVFSVVFLLPIEILTFGKFMFSTNPSPIVIKPVSYFLLLGLDALCLLWSIVLYVIGVSVLYDVRAAKASLLSGIALVVLGVLIVAGALAFIGSESHADGDTFFTAGLVLRNEHVWKR